MDKTGQNVQIFEDVLFFQVPKHTKAFSFRQPPSIQLTRNKLN